MPCCPSSTSKQTVKNGHIYTDKQRFLCHTCGRQFVEHPTNKLIDSKTRELIDRLRLGRISMAGIARAVKVSEQWLQDYINAKSAQTVTQAEVQLKKRASNSAVRRTLVICRRLALDADTREIIGAHVGSRGQESAQAL